MKKSVIIIITHLKEIELPNFTLDELRKFPAHYEKMFEAVKTTFILNYSLPKKINEKSYLDHYLAKLKTTHNAYSVEIGTLQNQIKQE